MVVADDHAGARRAVRRVLEWNAGFDLVGEAGDGRSAVVLCVLARPDVALIDVRMPDMGGFEAVRAIRAALPAARVVLFTAFADAAARAQAHAAGATALVGKDAPLDELLAVLRGVPAA